MPPGYSESLSHNRSIVDKLADKGYDAFTFRQPRKKAGAASDIPDRNTRILQEVIAATVPAGEEIHAAAHLFGSIALLRAARAEPERFAEVILMQPSGLMGAQNLLRLAGHTGRKVIKNNINTIKDRHLYRITGKPENKTKRSHSTSTRNLLRAQLSSGYVIAKNPRLALHEALTANRHDISSDIAAVQNLGIPVHIIVAHGDELFSMDGDGAELRRISILPAATTHLSIKTRCMTPSGSIPNRQQVLSTD